MKKKIICLIGPTAVGKTEVALHLAKKIGAEIISCDSMQVYKGIDIATSKPTKSQRRKVPHHLLDVVSPACEYNAASFRSLCLKIIKDIHRRGKLPLIVAGTGFYLRALLNGLFPGPGQDKILRQKLYQKAQRYGPDYLYQRLKNNDPKTAANIHPHDMRRIIRALEVYQSTGKPISDLRKKTSGIRDEYDFYIFGLQKPRDELYARIEQRVEGMFKQGLVAEMKRLTQGKLSQTVKHLLGYKEVKGFLEGKFSEDEARQLLKRNTRHYAKRQLTWFRREKDVRWVEINSKDSPAAIAERISTFLV